MKQQKHKLKYKFLHMIFVFLLDRKYKKKPSNFTGLNKYNIRINYSRIILSE